MSHFFKNMIVLLKNNIIWPEIPFYFAVPLFGGVFVKFRQFVTLAHGCLKNLSSKFYTELKILTVLGQSGLFGVREKKRGRTPIRVCCVCLPFFDSLVCAYSVNTHNGPLFSFKHTATS